MFAGFEVILGGVDEGQSEIEHQVDDERSDALSQEHLTEGKKWGERMSCMLLCTLSASCVLCGHLGTKGTQKGHVDGARNYH